ncbi:NAD(P)-dependent oxidoreductase [Actinomadura sp. HBU206391]|uniref:NAD(P)-dependent oxidoreductase n=1 Tax=Actinomadura sp. HBU206391 TaxID=2731692 RepID=UPI00165000C2|nr:NAD(P)-dependent oxidoreductase [Actinomadura sp. HBU206391]MBC6460588.1 3-phosphoglycerate dehydrogenase [Actinomadura sp. HBU206391]
MAHGPWRILALPPLDAAIFRPMFADLAAEVSVPETRDREGLHAALAEAELIIGDFTGALALDADAVAAAPRLAFVQMPQVGVDSCDLAALTAAKVPVANTAGANARAVAEWAVAAAFALCRHLIWGDRRMRAGSWSQSELLGRGTREIHTQRVGILGYGAIGAEAARMFESLGCTVSYWSRRRRPDVSPAYLDLDELVGWSDILVVALPRTPETVGLLGPERLALMPQGAFLVNVARGGIAPDQAVFEALDSGRLAGAALDVFEPEPLASDHPLRSHENVLLSPHVAGATGQAQLNILSQVAANIAAAVNGAPVINVVNDVAPRIHRRLPDGSLAE